MTKERFLEIQKNLKKGVNYAIQWCSDVKTLKSAPNGLEIKKYSKGVGRLGIDYTHTKVYKQKNIEGLANDSKLPYGEFVLFPWLIEYNGEYYLRIYTSSFNTKTKTKYFQSDNVVGQFELTKKELETMVENKYISSTTLKSKELESGCFNVKLKNVISINGEC